MSKREVSAASNSAMNSMQTDRSVDAVVVPEEVEKMEVKTEDGVTSAAPTAAIAPTLGAVGSSDAALVGDVVPASATVGTQVDGQGRHQGPVTNQQLQKDAFVGLAMGQLHRLRQTLRAEFARFLMDALANDNGELGHVLEVSCVITFYIT
jgi:hypothetical protein